MYPISFMKIEYSSKNCSCYKKKNIDSHTILIMSRNNTLLLNKSTISVGNGSSMSNIVGRLKSIMTFCKRINLC